MERIVSIDVVKAVAILAVVLGHIASPFGAFIFSWHMPVFFMLSGMLMAVKDTRKGLKQPDHVWDYHDLKYLGKFYISFCILGFIVEYIKRIVLHREQLDIFTEVVGIMLFGDYNHLHHYGFVLWFLPALFWAKTFSRFLLHSRYYIAFILSIILLMGTIKYTEGGYLSLSHGAMNTIWVVSGYIAYYNKDLLDTLNHWVVIAFLTILVIIINVPPLNLSICEMPSPFVNVLYAYLVLVTLLLWAKRTEPLLNDNRYVYLLSKCSIYIMAIHVYTNNIATGVVSHFVNAAYNWIFIFIGSLLMMRLLYWGVLKVKHDDGSIGL